MTRYRSIPVWPELRRYVATIQVEEATDAEPNMEGGKAAVAARVLPTPFAVLGFQFQGRLAVIHGGPDRARQRERLLDRSGISVLQSTARQFVPLHDAQSVLVMLHPAAAFSLVRWPMHELADEQVGLSDLLPVEAVRVLEDRLMEAHTSAERGAIVQQFLLELFTRSAVAAHPVVAEATRRIVATGGRLRVRPLADVLAISERQLERLFRDQIGTSPKQFASLVQFDWAWKHAQGGRSLSALATDAGYADQAHLTRAFVLRTGLPPTRLLADPPSA